MGSSGCKDLDATQNPNFELTALGDDLTVQLLSHLEQFEDHSWQILRNIGLWDFIETLKNPKFLERTKTLISAVLGGGLTVQSFEQT